MRSNFAEQISSDDGATPAGAGWNAFAVWKTSIHDMREQRRAGQSWADYMDDMEDRLLLRRRQFRRLTARVLLAVVLAVTVYVMF